MANICTHIAVVSATDRILPEKVVKEMTERFECYSDIETDSGWCELEFCSRGPFPLEVMKGITDKYAGKNLYIQVVTYELANELVQHHIYEQGKWTDKLAEKYQNTPDTKG
jgi:hypothetical protein